MRNNFRPETLIVLRAINQEIRFAKSVTLQGRITYFMTQGALKSENWDRTNIESSGMVVQVVIAKITVDRWSIEWINAKHETYWLRIFAGAGIRAERRSETERFAPGYSIGDWYR